MPEPNAFALPGGQIFVTRGMLELGLSDDMMAALLGHEIGHVVEEHSIHMQKKATLMNILSQALLVGVLIGAESSSGGGGKNRIRTADDLLYGRRPSSNTGDMVQGAAAASLVVSELLLRSYSRENESEADRDGQRWAAAAGFAPDGAEKLMAKMGERIPQDKRYGYWMTHPFFDERVRGARDLAALLQAKPPASAAAYRERTQATLLAYAAQHKPKEKIAQLLDAEALDAWPQGSAAEDLRLAKLHALRDVELAKPELGRDYGVLLAAYRAQADQVAALTPGSDFLKRLADERTTLEAARDALYAKAVQTLAGGVYETSFLETFLSNYPEAPEVPKTALALADADARLGHEAEAVRLYLEAWKAAPESAFGRQAAAGLRNMAPSLDTLAALQELATQDRDAELASMAASRLQDKAKSFSDIANGADYLKRFPDGDVSDAVLERVNHLADDLYAEVVLYQAVGDHVKALERINEILTHAPTSHAAERLRDRAVVQS